MSGRKKSKALIIHVVFVGTLVVPGMVWTATVDQGRAEGRSYSVPIPNGFAILEDTKNPHVSQLRSTGGLVLVQSERPPLENAYRANMVVVPVQMPGTIDLQSKKKCVMVAYKSAGSVGGTVQSAGIAQLSSGMYCQYTVRYPNNPNRGATGTIFWTPEETWLLTCNYDTRDAAAISACTQVLNGWKFTR